MSVKRMGVKVMDENGQLREIPKVKHTPILFNRGEDCIIPNNKKLSPEAVNHPSHYNSGNIETIEAIEDWGFGQGFNLGNAIKYISRANHKNDCLEDLKKAKWYIEREIQRLEKENTPIQPIRVTSVLEQNEECVCVLDSALESTAQQSDDSTDVDNSPVATLLSYDDDIKLSDVIKSSDAIGVNYQLPRLTVEDINRVNRWYKTHKDGECSCKCVGAVGGRVSFEIVPTSLGDIISVKCSDCKEEFLLGGV